MSIADYCYQCGHDLIGDICDQDYCRCACTGDDDRKY